MHFLVYNMGMLIVARALVGVAGGALTVLTPMYLGEISPLAIRGSIGTMTQVSVVFGILASILLAFALCDRIRMEVDLSAHPGYWFVSNISRCVLSSGESPLAQTQGERIGGKGHSRSLQWYYQYTGM